MRVSRHLVGAYGVYPLGGPKDPRHPPPHDVRTPMDGGIGTIPPSVTTGPKGLRPQSDVRFLYRNCTQTVESPQKFAKTACQAVPIKLISSTAMPTTAPLLAAIEKRTRELVAENLRSTAVVIARLVDLITEANQHGHPHADILESIKAGGLNTSLNNYRVYLHRYRTKQAKGATERPPLPSVQPQGGHQREIEITQPDEPVALEADATAANTVMQVRDALAGAKMTAASTDYSKIARAHSRKPKK